MTVIHSLLNQLWTEYCRVNVQASAIHALLEERGDVVHNDHIAFRTFDHPLIDIDQLAVPFLESGYTQNGEYHFSEKKLSAKHFEHADPSLPKIFISELLVGQFSDRLQATVKSLVDQLPDQVDQPICASGRPWKTDHETYQRLQSESEYAAWLAAHGFCANHFTVSVNHLRSITTLEELNQLLTEAGFQLNTQGGAIKGSPNVFLEQSSTIASKVSVDFSDGPHTIPGCYYEFAKRYELPNGELFSGFVTKSADKIFESTDERN